MNTSPHTVTANLMLTCRSHRAATVLRVFTLALLLATLAAAPYSPPARGADLAPTQSPWTYTTPLPFPRHAFSAVMGDNRIYILGGNTSINDQGIIEFTASVQSAALNPDGSLGPWQDLAPLVEPRSSFDAVLYDNHMYVFGGQKPPLLYKYIERATILPDGSLSAWTVILDDPNLPNMFNAGVVHLGNRIYVIGSGGYPSDNYMVYYATITAEHTLTPWRTGPRTLGPFTVHSAVANNGYFYAIGGICCPDNRVERAPLLPDGSLGPWQSATPLTAGRGLHRSVVDGNHIYTIGGCSILSGCPLASVERATVAPDGTLSTWTNLQPLNQPRQNHAALTANGYLYVLGGADAYGNATATVEVARLDTLAPDAPFGMTINDGALFTNQTTVTLTLAAPWTTDEMSVSNDGGFAGATWEPFTAQKPWTITAFGNYVIPRVVYVRFRTDGVVSPVYQDDIILDITPPTGAIEIIPAAAESSSPPQPPLRVALDQELFMPVLVKSEAPATRAVTLHLPATDDVSGVAAVLIANLPTFADARWEPYVEHKPWFVYPDRPTEVFVRFRDHAGNLSVVVSAIHTP